MSEVLLVMGDYIWCVWMFSASRGRWVRAACIYTSVQKANVWARDICHSFTHSVFAIVMQALMLVRSQIKHPFFIGFNKLSLSFCLSPSPFVFRH